MSFAEVRLPGQFDFGTALLPEFDVDTVIVGSGFELRNLRHDIPIRRGDIGSRQLITADYEKLYQFYMARRGTFEGFRYRNPTDHIVTDAPLSPAGTPTVQLTKTYSDADGNTFVREIKKPASGSTFKRGGSPYSPASVDTTTGVVTLAKDADLTVSDVTAAAPAAVTTSSAHGLSTGDVIYITGTGLSAIDGQAWTITLVDTDTFSLDGSDTTGTGGASSGAAEQYVQPGETLTWSGEFDIPVRFDGPWPNEYVMEGADGTQIVSVDRIPVKELRV